MTEDSHRPLKVFLFIIITAIIVASVTIIGALIWKKWFEPAPDIAFTPTSIPGVGSSITGKDGTALMYVPEGEFKMGSNSAGNNSGEDDEDPVHTVYLNAFWIDQTEVTNRMYSQCVNKGVCTEPRKISSQTHPSYYNNPEFDDYPVMYVNWNQANAYCIYVQRRLPTEAEWEKAARGTDGRTYSWGENIDCNKANYNESCVGDTVKVRSYERGQSPYGVYDMAGNVWEWVSSLYKPYLYDANDGRENINSTDPRVFRSGMWNSDGFFVRAADRNAINPLSSYANIGFRCARSP